MREGLGLRGLWLVVVGVWLVGCADSAPVDLMPTAIEVTDLAGRLESGEAPFILDVRSAAEFEAGHVPGAVHIPHTEVASRIGELAADRSDEIVVYCRSGRRAGIAQAVLRDAGFSSVRDLSGHFLAWSDAGLPVEMP